MSRTYRRDAVPLDCNCGAPIGPHWRWQMWERTPTPSEVQREIKRSASDGVPPQRTCFCHTNRKYNFYTKRNRKRDKTGWFKWWKPGKGCAKISRRLLRAKERDAFANEKYDIIPYFRKQFSWLFW